MLVIILLPLTQTVAKDKVVFATLGYDVIWLMVSAFVLTSAMIKSNIARRFALWMITHFGQTPRKAMFVLVLINFILVSSYLLPLRSFTHGTNLFNFTGNLSCGTG